MSKKIHPASVLNNDSDGISLKSKFNRLSGQNLLHIAIDGNEANVKNRVGSNMYAFELIHAIYHLIEKRDDLRVTILLSGEKLKDLPAKTVNWSYQIITPKKFWTQWALPIHLFWNKNKYDVFFTPGHYAPRICSIPYISSVMDLAFLYFPDQFKKNDLIQLTRWTKYSVKNANKVLTISKSTQEDVIREYHLEKKRTFVVYPALTSNPEPKSQKPEIKRGEKIKIKNPYLLYVGTLQPRKNLIKLVEAFETTKRFLQAQEISSSKYKKFSHLELIIAGKIGWLADDIISKVENSSFRKDIKLVGFVNDQEKQVLYKNALASLLIGLYEGFGIPPLESMAQGTIPIVANNSSLPEVVGDAGVLVDGNNIKSISLGIRQVLEMSVKQRAIYRRKMREQVAKFSWEKSAEKVIEELVLIISAK